MEFSLLTNISNDRHELSLSLHNSKTLESPLIRHSFCALLAIHAQAPTLQVRSFECIRHATRIFKNAGREARLYPILVRYHV